MLFNNLNIYNISKIYSLKFYMYVYRCVKGVMKLCKQISFIGSKQPRTSSNESTNILLVIMLSNDDKNIKVCFILYKKKKIIGLLSYKFK